MRTIRITTGIAIAACVARLQAGAEPAPLHGSAQSMSGKFTGAVKVQNGKLTVGDRELPLEDTLYLEMQTPDVQQPPTNALRLADGDYWRVELLGLSNRTVTVRSPEMGERQVDLTSVLSFEFSPEETMPDMDRPATMYRREGAALPGTLVWIKDRDVAVESLLGVLPLPRQSLVRYVLRQPVPGGVVALDELRLTDGSLYHGRLGADGDQITLQHAVAGTMKVQPGQIRYFSRHTPRIQWLSALAARSEPGAAPLGQPAAPELIAHRPEAVAAPCMQALRIQPSTVLRYSVPAAKSAWVFQATIAPRPSNVGDVQIEVRAGSDALLQRTLAPSSKPEAVALQLPAGKELEIAVAYGDRLAFPAGVDLCDPFVRAAE